MRKILFIILVYSLNYGQIKPIGKYESMYYENKTDDNFIIDSYKSSIKIDEEFNFTLKIESTGGCTMVDNHKYNGICKLKKDTLILVSPLPKKFIEQISDTVTKLNTFTYSIRNFSTTKVESYIENLNFYFIDNEMNVKQTKPIYVKTKFNITDTQSLENQNELIVTFEIPENSLFFKKNDKSEWNNVTLNVKDIEGKTFTLIKDYRNLSIDYNPHIGESYLDLTLRKYIIKKKGAKLKIIKKKGSFEDDVFQKK